MAYLDRVLEAPSYGWSQRPRSAQILREFASRLNVLRDRRNWAGATNWFWCLAGVPFLIVFFIHYFSWWLVLAGFLYSMVIMGSYGTIWFHRYATHRAFTFSNRVSRFITRNLVPKILMEETYVVSHHVHHSRPDKAGDPYNAPFGFLYCFLADVNHQLIARNLSESDYARTSRMLRHTGVRINSYEQYKRWGSLAHPFWTVLHFVLSWSFWFGVFYLLGGPALACALLGSAAVWAFGVRTFNFDGHGKGVDRRREGIDFNRDDLSINRAWPGIVAGEWHNNHHLYPNAARSGFLRRQIDLPWYYIRLLHRLGGIATFRDARQRFLKDHYLPYLEKKRLGTQEPAAETAQVAGRDADPVTAERP